jgi:hypothetical protein
MADQQYLAALLEMIARFRVHLRDEGTSGVQKEHLAGAGSGGNRLGYPMCRKDHGGVGFGDLVQLLHKNGTFGLQGLHHVTVVDDFMAYVDRCSEPLQCQFDDLDGTIDARAEAARRRHEEGDWGTRSLRRHG